MIKEFIKRILCCGKFTKVELYEPEEISWREFIKETGKRDLWSEQINNMRDLRHRRELSAEADMH